VYIITENIDKVNGKWPRFRDYDTYRFRIKWELQGPVSGFLFTSYSGV